MGPERMDGKLVGLAKFLQGLSGGALGDAKAAAIQAWATEWLEGVAGEVSTLADLASVTLDAFRKLRPRVDTNEEITVQDFLEALVAATADLDAAEGEEGGDEAEAP